MIGERLKELRKEKGIEAQYIAKKLNVSKSTYSYYENNKSQPNLETLNKLADIFEVTTDYLLGRSHRKETIILEEKELPKELQNIGIEYLEVNKELKEKGFTPEDIRELINTIESLKKNNNQK